MAGKKDVILNFFEQLMQIAMSQEIYFERERQRQKERTKLICQEPNADILSFFFLPNLLLLTTWKSIELGF